MPDVFRPYLAENVPQEAFVPRAVYDMELSPKDMTLPLAEALRALAPFGMGNPSPIFRLRDVRPINPVAMGAENRHLRFSLARSRNLRDALPCVAYSMGGRQEEMSAAREDLLCSLEINDWRGERKGAGRGAAGARSAAGRSAGFPGRERSEIL